MEKASVVMLGAGSWGTALAWRLATNGVAVRLWGRDPEQMCLMQESRENQRYLPGAMFPDSLQCFSDLGEALHGVTDWIIAVPSHAFANFLQQLQPFVTSSVRIAWVTKGLDQAHHRPLHETVASAFPGVSMAALSGPSLAAEVAQGLPTAISVAGNDDSFNQALAQYFHAAEFRVYQNPDLIGVELCAALKNVLAIGAGIGDGLGLGANARAALITRGLVEMRRLCAALGGQAETLSGLAGLGDLLLTATDDRSRNRRFGLALGRGQSSEEALAEIGQVVEGQANCLHAYKLASSLGVSAPITEQVYRVVHEGLAPAEAVRELMQRDPTVE